MKKLHKRPNKQQISLEIVNGFGQKQEQYTSAYLFQDEH